MAQLGFATASMRRLSAGLIGVLLVMGLPGGAVADDDDRKRTISISASGYVTAEPDVATIAIGVETEADTAGVALDDNADRFSAVLAAIKKLGIASKDISSEQFRVSPIYSNVKTGPGIERQQIVAFRVFNNAVVTVRAVSRTGEVIDKAGEHGANRIGDIDFIVSDLETKLDEARLQAMGNAIRRAGLYAEAAGAELGKVLSINEQFHGGPSPGPVYQRSMRASATPVEPGARRIGVTVNVVWQLK